MTEWKSLRELGVQPGDVVQYEHDPPRTVADICNDGSCGMTDKSRWFLGSPDWTLVSRAADRQEAYSGNKPISLRDMTAEQIGLLVKASLAGKKIEYFCPLRGAWVVTASPPWLESTLYRVRPEPRIEVVDLIADGKRVGTVEMEGGQINPASAKWGIGDE